MGVVSNPENWSVAKIKKTLTEHKISYGPEVVEKDDLLALLRQVPEMKSRGW